MLTATIRLKSQKRIQNVDSLIMRLVIKEKDADSGRTMGIDIERTLVLAMPNYFLENRCIPGMRFEKLLQLLKSHIISSEFNCR